MDRVIFARKTEGGRGRINNMIDRRPWASLTWRAEERESQYPTVSHKEKSIYCIQRKEKLTWLYTWLINMLLITSDLKAVVINLMPAQPPLFCSQCFHQMLDLLQGFVHRKHNPTTATANVDEGEVIDRRQLDWFQFLDDVHPGGSFSSDWL